MNLPTLAAAHIAYAESLRGGHTPDGLRIVRVEMHEESAPGEVPQ